VRDGPRGGRRQSLPVRRIRADIGCREQRVDRGSDPFERFVADLRATGRRRLVAASRAIDTYLAEAPLAQRLTASGAPAELIFGQLDARITPPPSNTLRRRHVNAAHRRRSHTAVGGP
jgi:hypothetical protein